MFTRESELWATAHAAPPLAEYERVTGEKAPGQPGVRRLISGILNAELPPRA